MVIVTQELKSDTERESKLFSVLFRLGMWWRIVYGSLKFFLGAAFLKWVMLDPAGLFYQLMRHEIIEDPGDLFIRMVRPIVEHTPAGTSLFIAVYLMFWGTIDVSSL